MGKAIYCCLIEYYTDLLKGNLKLKAEEIPEPDLYAFFSQTGNISDILVLGELINNPINIAQKIYSLDNTLSIIIIASEQDYQKYKQALKFTPFIGNTIHCISSKKQGEFIDIIEEMIAKTKQRRDYSRLKFNIKELVHTEHAEIIKKEYLDKYLEKAPIGAVLLDNEGLIMAVNESVTEIFDKKESEILGTCFSSLFSETTKKEIEDFIEKDFIFNSKKTFEATQGKENQFLEVTLAEIAPVDSKYKIAIVNDITDKVISQKQVQQQLQELESLNIQLSSSNRDLRKANQELDNFIYTASHDLKAPILNIEGLVRALEKELKTPDSKIETILNLIKRSIEKFKETIVDLTEISKIQSELGEDIKTVSVKELIDEVSFLILESIESTGTKIETDLKCPAIHFSRKNLKSIFYNLITNSIKYRSSDRVPLIQITSELEYPYVLISVKDNGLGFDHHKKERIFEMFKRLHNHVEGTGIGLYIVKKIVENTGGKIEVESKIDEGTTFKIYLKG